MILREVHETIRLCGTDVLKDGSWSEVFESEADRETAHAWLAWAKTLPNTAFVAGEVIKTTSHYVGYSDAYGPHVLVEVERYSIREGAIHDAIVF